MPIFPPCSRARRLSALARATDSSSRRSVMLIMRKPTALPSATEALPGRAQAIPTATIHFVNGSKLQPPYPAGLEQAMFGLGCFWGAERKFWQLCDVIYTTAVG